MRAGLGVQSMQTTMMMTSRPLALAQPRLPQRAGLQIVHAKKETSSGQDSYSKIEAPGAQPVCSLHLSFPCMSRGCSCIACVCPCSLLSPRLPCAVRGEIPDGGQPVAERDAESRGILTSPNQPDQQLTGSDIAAADAMRFMVRLLCTCFEQTLHMAC